MKSLQLLLLLLPIFYFSTACENEEASQPEGLLGTWELVEMYADPGDGSGDFQPVDNEEQITFTSDTTYTARGTICMFGVQPNTGPSTGTVNLEESTLIPNDCITTQPELLEIRFEIIGKDLILSYLCIEPCQMKFRRT